MRNPFLAVLLVCVGLFCVVQECQALSCVDEMIIAGEDQNADWGCVVDVTPDGRAWVVWTGHDTLDYDEEVYYTVHGPEGWSQPGRVHPDNDLGDRSPRLSVGVDGVPWVVWRGPTDSGYGLLASRWSAQGWTPAETVRESAGRYDRPDLLAIDSSNVWLATDTASGSHLKVLVYHWDGVEWSAPWQFGGAGTDDCAPDLGLDPEGSPWIVWESEDDGPRITSILCSAWSDTGWTAPSVVNADTGNIGGPQIVFDEARPLVVWIGNGNIGTGADLEYSVLEDHSWTPSALASQPDGPDDYDHAHVCEGRVPGEIRLSWFAGNTHLYWSAAVVTARWNGEGWGPEHQVSADATRKRDTYPDMALTPDGGAWFAWTCYHEVAPPWDEDIRGTFCSQTTPVSFGALEAVPDAGSTRVTISWYADGEACYGPFHIWRALGAPESQDASAEPWPSADRLTQDPITSAPYEWVDRDVRTGTSYLYWVQWSRPQGDVHLGPVSALLPGSTSDLPARLLYALPNPSTAGSRIAYHQSVDGTAGFVVYDVSGRRVAHVHAPHRPPGRYDQVSDSLWWDGHDSHGNQVSSGVYLLQLTMDGAPVLGQRTRITVLD